MAVYFQSLRSSSAGNCLALWTPTSSILIDCGLKVQRECRDVLDGHVQRAGSLDAVVVSHAHGDHMAYGALRVLGRQRIPVLADARVIVDLRLRHEPDDWDHRPRMHALSGTGTDVGDFTIARVEVPHEPSVATFGFVITARDRGRTRTIVACTDFNDYEAILPHLVGADFIFVEANHDRELLRKHPNYASRYHLDNVNTASLLHRAVKRSASAPGAVMLGHLSEERNRHGLATGEVVRTFERQGTTMRFHLDAAPARRPSDVVEI